MAKHGKVRELLRALPAVHRLIEHQAVRLFAAERSAPHDLLVSAAQEVLQDWRSRLLEGADMIPNIEDQLAEELMDRLTLWLSPRLRRVINGTGVVLHTNLGRAPLDRASASQIVDTATRYSNLEYNLAEGRRGTRDSHVEELICRLTGAEAATIVNNNAAAVFLVLHELARGKEVIVSRGQLVEIGGSFRISEIMVESGARLVEVGTTNKTHLSDYERALTDQTALLLKVHTSNFRMIGFTSEVSGEELARLGRVRGIPVYEDLGSGMLIDLKKYGIGDEPSVRDVLATDIDLVSFSGDKLLGGPQTGIIAGKRKWIERLKQSQLARALRVDKLTLAGLESVLRSYLQPDAAIKQIPVLRDILQPVLKIEEKAREFIRLIEGGGVQDIEIRMVDEVSEIGGGTLPGVQLPTKAVSLQIPGVTANRTAEMLRRNEIPIIARISQERILLDFRTIMQDEISLLAAAVRKMVTEKAGN